jgi:hypothetical protein
MSLLVVPILRMNEERYSKAVSEGPDTDPALVASVSRVDELRLVEQA